MVPPLILIPNFLSQAECEQHILYAEQAGFEPAKVSLPSGARRIEGIRNNDRIMVESPTLAQRYWDRLKGQIPAQIEGWEACGLNEVFRYYRYEGKQRFNRHRDGSFRRSPTEESRYTFLVYLNDDLEGGETEFDKRSISPSQGMALLFLHPLKHKGCQVTRGVKYVLRSDLMYRWTQAKPLP